MVEPAQTAGEGFAQRAYTDGQAIGKQVRLPFRNYYELCKPTISLDTKRAQGLAVRNET
ncbi:MAG: hypothetical protein ACYCXY_07180 [Acidimicrobiales bacterium]